MITDQYSKELLLSKIEEIGKQVNEFADDVDKKGRFPQESIQLLKKYQLMSAYIPKELGGLGMNIEELAEIGKVIGKYCASTSMIWAMHQVQIACLVHHGSNQESIQTYLRKAANYQHLVASVTSEVGTGGDISRSIAGVDYDSTKGFLSKKGSVVSYGNYADSYLVTSKRKIDGAEGDQILILLERETVSLEQTSEWDTLGMRGTCSDGFTISASFPLNNILEASYREISTQTMVPFSHILWSSAWYGVSQDAVYKARKLTKKKMKQNLKEGKSEPINHGLVEVNNKLTMMRNTLDECTKTYSSLINNYTLNVEKLNGLTYSLGINNLKVISSELAVEIVQKCLLICGFSGFQNNTPYSLGRSLRDILSSVIMIHNDRLNTTSSSLLMLQR